MGKCFLFLTLLNISILVGCVEVRDDEDKTAKATPSAVFELGETSPSAEIHLPSLTVDQPLVLHKGEVLRLDKYRQLPLDAKTGASGSYEFDVLEFREGGVLYTMGSDVTLRANTLVSDSGELATFPHNMKALPDQRGRDGGLIFVRATSAQGELRVVLRGENGADGKQGDDRTPDMKGADGQDALALSVACIFEDSKPTSWYLGSPGERGARGKPGYPGKAGGNTGSFDLFVERKTDLLVSVLKIVGLGGVGGYGGRGGEGGVEGFSCANKYNGEPRPVAPEGPQGTMAGKGADGQPQSACIQSNGISVCK